MSEPLTYVLLCLSAFAAGGVNAVAGGGTLLTFPVLVWALRDAGDDAEKLANVTSTVALVLGSLAGAWGFRNELRPGRDWLLLLLWPSLLGGLTGSFLLILLPGKIFLVVVPWLLLTAALLFLFQPYISRHFAAGGATSMPSSSFRAIVVLFQFVVAVYGGYFGAGIGVLMLSALGLMGLHDIHRMNAIKTLLAAVINGVSVLVFLSQATIVWRYAAPMTLAAILGGYAGARASRNLPKALIRWLVIAIGLGLSGYYFLRSL